MAPLIRRLRRCVSDYATPPVVQEVAGFAFRTLAARHGYARGGLERPEIVLAPDVALELGHPGTAAQSFVLLTCGDDVCAGRLTRVGWDFDGLERRPVGPTARRPFAQVVLLRVSPDCPPDPFVLDNAQYLTDRLPGYMVRSVPGRLWARISRAGRRAGLDLTILGQALMARYLEIDGVEAVEVLFVTSSAQDVEALAPLAHEAHILSGQHKKLVLSDDGLVDCLDLSCEACDERALCDALRDVIVRRRRYA
jgi:CO dehydrogenase/acetyl-CoA synthase beta subunit